MIEIMVKYQRFLYVKLYLKLNYSRFPSDVRGAFWDYRFRYGNYQAKEIIKTYEEGLENDDQYFNKFTSCFN